MKIINENPYRLLGIYSNSSVKERVANINRLKSFLRVGRSVSFPLDLPELLPAVNRTNESVAKAESDLALPKEQLRYAQFWFVKATTVDDIAFNNLTGGNVDKAISIWEKKENVSSLQNRIVCALIKDNLSDALSCAEKLYSQYLQEFVKTIIGDDIATNIENIEYDFLSELCSNYGLDRILPFIVNSEWKENLKRQEIRPLLEALQSSLDAAKSTRKQGAGVRYNAGVKLMNYTKPVFVKLKGLISDTDLQYQTMADKVGLEILQCGIDYFNHSEEPDAAHKAMRLQSYAQSLVVGKMAKDRCKENVDILNRIIENLPPLEVFAEDKAIKNELRKFQEENSGLKGCKDLLFKCEPYLILMKEKVGIKNEYYIRVSTVLANVLLNFIVETFNKDLNDELKDRISANEKEAFFKLMWILRFSWTMLANIELLDASKEFKRDRLIPNKDTIKNLIGQIDNSFSEEGLLSHAGSSALGEFAINFLSQYNKAWNINSYMDLSLERERRLRDMMMGLSLERRMISNIPPTYGFMLNWINDGLIDLRTEEDYFKECKSSYDKKITEGVAPYDYKYDTYIKKFPNGKFIKEVKSYKSISQREYKLYKENCSTIEGCKHYVTTYPNGWYINKIKEQLENLIFEYYKSKKQLSTYIREYPNGKNVSKAKEIIKKRNKAVLMWILGILIPTAIILLFVLLDWSIIAAILIALFATAAVLGQLLDD